MAELKNLDALANQLYMEGLDKAKKESDQLLSDARSKSEAIINAAEKEASDIITKAHKEADKRASAADAEIRQKARQAKQDLMDQIQHLMTLKTLDSPLKEVFSLTDFVEKMMLSAVDAWKNGEDVEVIISKVIADHSVDIEKRIQTSLPDVNVSISEELDRGFIIEAKGEGYRLSFTEADFRAFFQPYLSTEIGRILFQADE